MVKKIANLFILLPLAIVLIGLCAGAGLQAARIWRTERDKPGPK